MKTLRRSNENRIIGGVCGGLAEYFNLDPVLVRLLFVILAILGGAGFILYIVAWIIMPEKKAKKGIQNAEIKDATGNIKNSIREVAEEFEGVAKELKDEFNEVEKEINSEVKGRKHPTGSWLGIFLIFLGAVFLLRVFGWFHFSWCGIWRYWPILLIIIGISCISMKRWLKNTLLIISLVALLIALISNRHHSGRHFSCHTHHTVHVSGNVLRVETSREGNFANLEVAVGASRLNLIETTEYLSEVWLDTERVSFLEFTEGARQGRTFRSDLPGGRNASNCVDIALNDSQIWDMEFNVGATRANLDLSAFKVREVEINSGAAHIDLKIGEKHPRTNIEINTGASNITVRVPKNADTKVRSTRVFMSKNLDGFVRSGNTHRTENFGSAEQTIIIEVSGAVGSFEVVRY